MDHGAQHHYCSSEQVAKWTRWNCRQQVCSLDAREKKAGGKK
jgi:hypothetical protein